MQNGSHAERLMKIEFSCSCMAVGLFGSVAATRATVARVSAEAKVKCLSINYRLAPEHPFPAAINDTYAAYEWLINEGISPKHIIVSGQSAGGGLCLVLLLKIKENNISQPLGAVALSLGLIFLKLEKQW